MKLLNELLNIKYPIIQGGMTHISNGIFAAQCSNSGALGVIASGGMLPEQLKKEIRDCREHTDKPFGVNIVMNHPFIDDILNLVISESVPVVITGNGDPSAYVKQMKEAGIFVIPVVGYPQAARFLERAGVDAIIAEGSESGGHIGHMSTMVLVPQVCDNTKLPVIAAGGIADPRQYKAALDLGACGVQVGTILLSSNECPIHPNYKEAVLKARSTDSVVTGELLGDPVRVIRNHMTDQYIEYEKKALDTEALQLLTLNSLKKAVFDGDIETGSMMAGTVCGQINSIKSLDMIFSDLCKDFL